MMVHTDLSQVLDYCGMCKPIRLDSQRFDSLYFLPSPIPTDDGPYRFFHDVYGKKTSEEHWPSLKAKRPCNSIGFTASQQHVKNVNIFIQCEECDLWRLLFCHHKLTIQERSLLKNILEDISYSCGATLEQLIFKDAQKVFVSKLMLAMIRWKNFIIHVGLNQFVIIYCGALLEDIVDFYLQCDSCSSKPKIARPKKQYFTSFFIYVVKRFLMIFIILVIILMIFIVIDNKKQPPSLIQIELKQDRKQGNQSRWPNKPGSSSSSSSAAAEPGRPHPSKHTSKTQFDYIDSQPRTQSLFGGGGGEKGLVSTVCACARFSWNSKKQYSSVTVSVF